MKPQIPEKRIDELLYSVNEHLMNNLPAGQTMFRPIRPRYPLSSQLIQDMMDEIKADLQTIIDSADVDLSSFINQVGPAVIDIEHTLTLKDLNTGQVQKSQIIDDHTTDWRTL